MEKPTFESQEHEELLGAIDRHMFENPHLVGHYRVLKSGATVITYEKADKSYPEWLTGVPDAMDEGLDTRIDLTQRR